MPQSPAQPPRPLRVGDRGWGEAGVPVPPAHALRSLESTQITLSVARGLRVLMMFCKKWAYTEAIFSSLDFDSVSTFSVSNNIPSCEGR